MATQLQALLADFERRGIERQHTGLVRSATRGGEWDRAEPVEADCPGGHPGIRPL